MNRLGLVSEDECHKMLCELSQLNIKDRGYGIFPENQWSVNIMSNGEHFPPHVHIVHKQPYFICRYDINTCKTIYEEGLTKEKDIDVNRARYTTNIEGMQNVVSFERLSVMLKEWYKQPNTKFSANGRSNYEYTVNEWNEMYGQTVCMCDMMDNMGYPKTKPKNKEELRDLIDIRVKNVGSGCDLNDIDVSLIKDMSMLFYQSEFNGDISEWNVSNVMNMQMMFYQSSFNGDITKWNISSKCLTNGMFDASSISTEHRPTCLNRN